MQILFVPAVAYSSREKDERNVRERERDRKERAELETLFLSLSVSTFLSFKSAEEDRVWRAACAWGVFNACYPAEPQSAFAAAVWPGPLVASSGNALWRKLAATADFEIAKHFHTLMVFDATTVAAAPALVRSPLSLSLPPFFALPLCFLVTASSYRCYPLCTFFSFFYFPLFFSSFFFLLVFSLVFFHCTRSVCILVIPAVLTLTSKPARRDKAEYPGSGERRFDGMERRGNRERRV